MDKIVGFLVRFVVISLIMFAFYNPITWNYVNWVFPTGFDPFIDWFGIHGLHFIVGLILIGAVIYLCRFTYHGLGRIGVVFVAAILVAIVGTLGYNVKMNYTSDIVITVLQVLFAILFAVGLVAAQINRRFAGQVTTIPSRDDEHAHHHHSS